jgi:glutamyl/glutaminyl-tRNA synthetase
VFAHVPMILGPDAKRLSKRHGAASVEAYREQGILPEALVNFLALLGWSPGDDREVMELDELAEAFTIERILKKSAVFDPEKLEWLNGKHLDRTPADRLVTLVLERMVPEARSVAVAEPERLAAVVDLQKTRARTIPSIAETSACYFVDPVRFDPAAVKKHWKNPAEAGRRLAADRDILAVTEPFERDPLETAFRALSERMEEGLGKLIHPLRVAVLGVADSPGIFDVLALLGRQRALRRIDDALVELERIAAQGKAG